MGGGFGLLFDVLDVAAGCVWWVCVEGDCVVLFLFVGCLNCGAVFAECFELCFGDAGEHFGDLCGVVASDGVEYDFVAAVVGDRGAHVG